MTKTYIDFFSRNGIEYIEIAPLDVDTYRQQWFDNFIPSDKKEKAIDSYCFNKDGCCGYLWHAFSYEILECIKNDDAKAMFNSFNKQDAVLLGNIDDVAFIVKDISKITAKDIDLFDDIMLTAIDFSWTYTKTHEMTCGPYFYAPNAK